MVFQVWSFLDGMLYFLRNTAKCLQVTEPRDYQAYKSSQTR